MHRTDRKGRPRERGLTYLELLVVVSVLLVLASAAIPLKHWDDKRRKEGHLRVHLETMRQALDDYHRYSEEGLIIQDDVERLGWPEDLEELVEGVEVGDPQSIDVEVRQFLRRIPVDPFTGEADWGLRSYQDDFDSRSWGGENVYDVYSLAEFEALDGTEYRDW
jgi:general secretion pathway protein G